MLNDAELLRRFAEEGSANAFDELARRHLDLVYSAALRQTGGHPHLAKDVTQMVLIDLARKAAVLKNRSPIVAWLHTATRYATATVLRGERHRKARETAAGTLSPQTADDATDAHWAAVRPTIDEALGELREPEREAVLLRYFKGRSYAAIGRELSLTETAARSRVDRALERLQLALRRRGIESTSAALATAILRGATTSAPADFAAAAIGAAVAAGAGGTAAAGGAMLAAFKSGKFAALAADLFAMKISTSLLVASLAANAALGALYVRRAALAASYERLAGISTAPLTRASATNPTTTSAAGQVASSIAKPTLDLTDQATLIRKMEEDGFDRKSIARGIEGLHHHWGRSAAQEDEERAWAQKRRWNPKRQSTEQQQAQTEKYRQRDAQAKAAIGAAGFDAPEGNNSRPELASLSREKTQAVRRIEKDYAEISGGLGGNSIDWEGADRKSGSVIWPEFQKDVRAVLSADEAARYFRSNSPAAKQVQQIIQRNPNLELGAETYNRIVDEAVAGATVLATLRQHLGEERFLSVIATIDSRAATVDGVFRDAGFSPGRRIDLFLQTSADVAALNAAPRAERAALARQTYDALVRAAGLSGPQLAAFDATPLGRALRETATREQAK
ncbi:MAG: sigma-70 family RNA polymerase sigma factor [Opitutaceae bacterium]